jgi:nucleoside-diphosphate-sugar epimerase
MARALGTFAIVLPLPLTVAVPTAFAIEAFWNLRGQPSIVSPDKIREAVAPSWAASAARARRDLGFAPVATLDERLAETVSWLRENGRL